MLRRSRCIQIFLSTTTTTTTTKLLFYCSPELLVQIYCTRRPPVFLDCGFGVPAWRLVQKVYQVQYNDPFDTMKSFCPYRQCSQIFWQFFPSWGWMRRRFRCVSSDFSYLTNNNDGGPGHSEHRRSRVTLPLSLAVPAGTVVKNYLCARSFLGVTVPPFEWIHRRVPFLFLLCLGGDGLFNVLKKNLKASKSLLSGRNRGVETNNKQRLLH